MLWYCAYTWHSSTNRQKVAQRLVQQHEAGEHHQERWRGWYSLAGGGSGFLLIETNDPREVTAMLQPYMDLMDWDVRGVYELDYNSTLETARQVAQQAT